jgi:hypothetical protein
LTEESSVVPSCKVLDGIVIKKIMGMILVVNWFRSWLSRLGTHYLCRSSEGLDDGLELEVIDKEEEMGNGKTSEAKDDRS